MSRGQWRSQDFSERGGHNDDTIEIWVFETLLVGGPPLTSAVALSLCASHRAGEWEDFENYFL